jgi:hypothetical protein
VKPTLQLILKQDNSISVVASYEVDDWGSISGGGTICSACLHVQADATAQKASCLMGIGGPLPGGKEAEP